MKTALFTNFSNEAFIGYWNGKGKRFEPGQSSYMPAYLAEHFAKHLTNRELLKKGLERSTSPKRPNDVPEYMELFNMAFILDGDETSPEKDSIDVQIEVANKNRANKSNASIPAEVSTKKEPSVNVKTTVQDPTQPQVIEVPEDGDDEEFENEVNK